MQHDKIYDLLTRHLSGRLSTEEDQELRKVISEPEYEVRVQEVLFELSMTADPGLAPKEWPADAEEILERDRISLIDAPVRRISRMRIWMAAAGILIVLGVGFWYYRIGSNAGSTPVIAAADIPSGTQGAVLTLADGSTVQLDMMNSKSVPSQAGVVANVINGRLAYEGQSTQLLFNTMTTPKGREFRLQLPDGTGVWLNAASSIRFPVSFPKDERRVIITGEVYFEVKPRSAPFIVQTPADQEIAVLGTSFNINSYDNEATINTTLLEGAIRIKTARGQTSVLKPGQQGLLTRLPGRSSEIKVTSQVNLSQVMAWKNGVFDFEGLEFREIMRQLERWYDIEVNYDGKVPNYPLEGKISRDVSLGGLLRGFTSMGINYRLNGKKLIISPPKTDVR